MRYFFHLHNDIEVTDEEGRELPDLDAAISHARQEALVMAGESASHGHLNLSHCIEVTDTDGASLKKVTFGDVVNVTDN